MKIRKLNFKALRNWMVNHPLVKRVVKWSQEHSLPGFFKVPIYDVVVFILRELRRFDLLTRANAIAYSFFLSLFPSIMALFTLIPLLKTYFLKYLPAGDNFENYLQYEIQKFMPGVAGDQLFKFIDDITSNPRIGLLSIGFLMAIFFSSNGMLMLMRGFAKSYSSTFKQRRSLKKRFIAIGLTFQLGVFLITSIVLIILGEFLLQFLDELLGLDQLSTTILNIVRWMVVISLFYVSIATIYRFGAATKQKFKLFTPGATLATFLCLLASVVFSAYVNNFNTYNELYGSIGTIIVIMLWLQINSMVLLMGYELNASIAVNRDMRAMLTEDTDDNDV